MWQFYSTWIEDGVLKIIEGVGVHRVDSLTQSLALGPLGLRVVHPEVAGRTFGARRVIVHQRELVVRICEKDTG